MTAAKCSAAYRDRETRGVVLVKTEPRAVDLFAAIAAFADARQDANYPAIIRRDLETIRAGNIDWTKDKALLGRVVTVVVVDEWSDRWSGDDA